MMLTRYIIINHTNFFQLIIVSLLQWFTASLISLRHTQNKTICTKKYNRSFTGRKRCVYIYITTQFLFYSYGLGYNSTILIYLAHARIAGAQAEQLCYNIMPP
jgi:hypothetical protein